MGLGTWLLAGFLVALAVRLILRGRRAAPALSSVLTALGGALVGGLLATYLGFGGLLAFDLRSLTVAALASLLAILVRYVLWSGHRT